MLPDQSAPRPSPQVAENGQPQDQSNNIKSQLLSLLNQAAKVAADNGVDFQEVIVQFMKGGVGSGHASPPPPKMGMGS